MQQLSYPFNGQGGGGGGGKGRVDATPILAPKRFLSFSWEVGQLLLIPTANFLASCRCIVGAPVHEKNISDWSYCLGPKVRQRDGAGMGGGGGGGSKN